LVAAVNVVERESGCKSLFKLKLVDVDIVDEVRMLELQGHGVTAELS